MVQVTESVEKTLGKKFEIDIAEEFCRGAAIKYLIRFGKKEGKNEKDLLKCLHYVILMYHYCGFDKKLIEETDGSRTR